MNTSAFAKHKFVDKYKCCASRLFLTFSRQHMWKHVRSKSSRPESKVLDTLWHPGIRKQLRWKASAKFIITTMPSTSFVGNGGAAGGGKGGVPGVRLSDSDGSVSNLLCSWQDWQRITGVNFNMRKTMEYEGVKSFPLEQNMRASACGSLFFREDAPRSRPRNPGPLANCHPAWDWEHEA